MVFQSQVSCFYPPPPSLASSPPSGGVQDRSNSINATIIERRACENGAATANNRTGAIGGDIGGGVGGGLMVAAAVTPPPLIHPGSGWIPPGGGVHTIASAAAIAPWTKHYAIDHYHQHQQHHHGILQSQPVTSPNNIRKCAIEAYPANGSFIGSSPPRKYTINELSIAKIAEEKESDQDIINPVKSSLLTGGKPLTSHSLQLFPTKSSTTADSSYLTNSGRKLSSTSSRERRRQNAGRFRTMPITLDEIREVEAEDELSNMPNDGGGGSSLVINSARSASANNSPKSSYANILADNDRNRNQPSCVRKLSDSEINSTKMSRSKSSLSASAAFRRNRSLSLPNGQLLRGDQGKLHFRFNDLDSLPPIPEEKQHPDKGCSNQTNPGCCLTRSISEQQQRCTEEEEFEGCESLQT